MKTTGAETIDAICAAIAAGDFDALERHIATDGVFLGTVGGIDEEAVLRGPAAFMRYWKDVAATWDEWLIRPERVLEQDDTFVVFWRETTKSREIEMQNETATVFTVRDGKIVEARGYLDRGAALEAAGLA
ncbi:MAG TPA: nuclear transport factor 2 family protein [Thermoleophilaceae bacterium]